MGHEDLSLLLAEIEDFSKSMDSSGLRESDLEGLKLPEDPELKLRLRKRDKVMDKVKTFLDCYDSFFNALASANPIAASLYGGLKCIVTVSLESKHPARRRHIPTILTDSFCQSGDLRR
jgi:hypothetical protein